MSKLPIEQQVAQLTPEQKENLGNIYKKYAISVFSVVIAFLILAGGCFLYFHTQANQAKEQWDTLDAMSDSYSLDGDFSAALSLSDDIDVAMDKYFDMQGAKFIAISVVCFVAVVAVLVVFLVFKKKYPYFSEKKYTYIKKLQKQGYMV